jgi:pyruvate/2-oxoglutarate dehydrogenase complex dihydrolipoamide acyltransferase (E2) component
MAEEYRNLGFPTHSAMAEDFLEWARDFHHAYLTGTVKAERIVAFMEAQEKAGAPVSLTSVLLKGLGMLVRENPEARTIFYTPPPRLVLFEACTATIPVEREMDGERFLFLAHIKDCDSRAIRDIDFEVNRYRSAPLDEIPEFGWLLKIARLPKPLRRAIYMPFRHVPFLRSLSSGVFGVTEAGAHGVDEYLPLAASTVTFGIGSLKERPVAENGAVAARLTLPVTLMFDRRAMDDLPAARLLEACVKKLEAAAFAEE